MGCYGVPNLYWLCMATLDLNTDYTIIVPKMSDLKQISLKLSTNSVLPSYCIHFQLPLE